MRTHCERTGNAGAARLFGKEEGAYRKAVLIAREMLAAAVPDVDFDPTTGSAPL